MARGLVIALLASFFVASSVAVTHVEILLSARNLPDMDVCCSPPVLGPDAYAIVYFAPSSFDSYIEQGQTRVLSDNHNPDWPDVYSFTVEDNTDARLKVDVMDSDVDADDYIGYAEVRILDLIQGFGNQIQKQLIAPKGDGSLIVYGRINGTRTADFYVPALTNMAKRAREISRLPKPHHV